MKKLEEFGGYQKAVVLFDYVVEDMASLVDNWDLSRLRSQQLASAVSICANMEEGSGRWSTKEFTQYLVISRGSTVETQGRYNRLRHWLPETVVRERMALCDEIAGILTSTINSLKRDV